VSRTRRPRPGPPSAEEVEGFLDGLTLRVDHSPTEERTRHLPALAEARGHLAQGHLVEAEALLVGIDRALDESEGEPELSEFPRGLVSYVPTGDRGLPTSDEEEPTANRIRLVARLIEVRRSEGRAVESWVGALRAAQDAYADGDRKRARRLCDAVLSDVEAAPADRRTAER
jgi:hypothetical protein